MKQRIKNIIFAVVFAASIGGGSMTLATPQVASAACSTRFLTFPAWYKGLIDDKCNLKPPASSKAGVQGYILTIVLNIVEIMLQLVGYISVAFIIFGGYKYLISKGTPDGMVAARKTIVNAIIGLGISILSVAIVNLVTRGIN